jgi:hypothetical protein
MMIANKEMKVSLKEDFTISISGDIARSIQQHYAKDDYSLMVENFFSLLLPKKAKNKSFPLSAQLRGCAAASGFVDKTDKEIKELMHKDKYGI